MPRNNAVQVFEGGWKEVENAVFTDNQFPFPSITVQSFFMKPDGAEIFATNSTDDDVKTFPLSRPYDVDTIGVESNSFPLSFSNPRGIFFKNDGAKMFVVDLLGDMLFEFVLPTPYDTSSIVDTPAQLDLDAAGISGPTEITFSRDGDILLITDNLTIFSFTLATPWDITSATNPTTPSTLPGEGAISIALKPEGDRLYIGASAPNDMIKEFALSTLNDITTATLTSSQLTEGNIPSTLRFRSNGQEFFTTRSFDDDITRFHTDQDWAVTNASHFTNIFPLDGVFEGRDIFWKPDGTQFIILDRGVPDSLKSYSTVAPWNPTGATLIFMKSTADIGLIDPDAMFWTKDGLNLYILNIDQRIFQSVASIPWDISTLTDTGKFLDIPEIASAAAGLFIRDDGKKFFATGLNIIVEYDMTTPFDISTGVINDTFSFGFAFPLGITFKLDGKIMYLVNASLNSLEVYDVPIPWDITSLVLKFSFDLMPFDSDPFGIAIREYDGKKLYIVGRNTDILTSFDLSKEFNNAIITAFGEELITDLGEILVHT